VQQGSVCWVSGRSSITVTARLPPKVDVTGSCGMFSVALDAGQSASSISSLERLMRSNIVCTASTSSMSVSVALAQDLDSMSPSPYFPAEPRLVTETFNVLSDLPDREVGVAQAHE